VSLRVEKVAPASDGLGQSYRRKYQVGQLQKVDFIVTADKNGHDDAGDDAAVDGKASAAYIEYRQRVVFISVPAEYNVVCTGADDGKGDEPESEIKYVITLDAVAWRSFEAYYYGKDKTRAYEDSVPHYVYSKNSKGYRAW